MKRFNIIPALILLLFTAMPVCAVTLTDADEAYLQDLVKKSCHDRDLDARLELFDIFDNSPISTKADYDKALAIADRSCFGRGLIFKIPNIQSWLEAEAEKGDADIQFFLGDILDRGDGLPPDPAAGRAWLEKAAAQGHLEAKYILFFHNECQDKAKALAILTEVAEAGHANAQYVLGIRYNNGSFFEPGDYCGFPQYDRHKAVYWWEKAAGQGHSGAMTELALMYNNEDDARAFKWALAAAEAGEAFSQGLVAEFYYTGTGTAPNLIAAYQWYQLSLWGDFNYLAETSEQQLQELETRMTPEEIDAAKERAEIWQRANRPNFN